jgi:hypothetical protein
MWIHNAVYDNENFLAHFVAKFYENLLNFVMYLFAETQTLHILQDNLYHTSYISVFQGNFRGV